MRAIDYRNQSLQAYPSEIISHNFHFLSQTYVFDSSAVYVSAME